MSGGEKRIAHRILLIKSAIGEERFRNEERARLLYTRVWSPIIYAFRRRILTGGVMEFTQADRKKLASVFLKVHHLGYDFGIDSTLRAMGRRGKLKPLFRKAGVDAAFVLTDASILSWMRRRAVVLSTHTVSAGSFALGDGNGRYFLNSSGTSWLTLDGTNLMMRATNGVTGRVQMIYE